MASYGPFSVLVPPLSDDDLIFDEDETKQIFKFFYPDWSAKIDALTIDNDGRAMAQTMLVAATDMSYGMGFVDQTWRAMMGQARSQKRELASLMKKLGKRFVQHWYQHTKQKDLLNDPVIYASIKDAIALKFNTFAGDYVSGNRLLSSNIKQNGFRSHVYG